MILKPILRPVLRPILRSISGVIQRYFTTLNKAAGQRYDPSSPLVLGDDFEIEFKFAWDAANTEAMTLLGGSIAENFRVSLNPVASGRKLFLRTRVSPAGSYVYFVNTSVAAPVAGVLYAAIVKKIGTDYTIAIDDASATIADTRPMEPMDVSQVAMALDGIIADMKVWTGGDRTTGTQVMDMPLDEDWQSSAVARNNAGPITATAINITSSDAELYTFNSAENEWVGNTSGNVLSVGY